MGGLSFSRYGQFLKVVVTNYILITSESELQLFYILANN